MSNIPKILKKIVYKGIAIFLKNYDILHNWPNGYAKQKSAARTMFQLLEKIVAGLNWKLVM